MRNLDLKDYPNLLDKVHLCQIDVENALLSMKLQFFNVRNSKVEWRMKFPIFLGSFYRYILRQQSVPSQKQFWDMYLFDNTEWFNGQSLEDEIMIALKARLFRTYPSLIRDLHFSLKLRECKLFGSVIYNAKLDVFEGVDVLITNKSSFYAVNLYTDTKNAFRGRKAKERRHSKFDNVFYIELPVTFLDENKHGDFFLYSDNSLILLKKEICQKM